MWRARLVADCRDPGDTTLMRLIALPLVKRVFAKSYADLARMEDVARASDLDWTIFRPPRLTNHTTRGTGWPSVTVCAVERRSPGSVWPPR